MFICYDCKKEFDNVPKLIDHIKQSCIARKRNVIAQYTCGQEFCFRHFSSSNSLRRHLLSQHVHHFLDESSMVPEARYLDSVSLDPGTTISLAVNAELTLILSETKKKIQEGILRFVSSLYTNPGIPRSSIQNFMSDFEQFMLIYNGSILQGVNFLVHHNISHLRIAESVKDFLRLGTSEVTNFNSDYKRLQAFEKRGTFIPSQEITIGSRLELVKGKMCQVPCTMQIIPIDLVLKNFLSIDYIFEDISEYLNSLNECPSTLLKNIVHGSTWKSQNFKNSNNELHLPLTLYFDEYEPNNALSSHAGVQKLAGVYVGLPFLPPKWSSKLINILILGVFHAHDRRAFGNKAVFQKIIDTLNSLSILGVKLKNSHFDGIVKFHVVCLTGDNLGLNGILGFVESFVANYCCRICSADRARLGTMVVEDKSLLRNMESYDMHLEQDDTSLTGLKEKCVFLDLKHFNLFENVAVDILHDYLEGCCKYVMSFVVNYIVKTVKAVSTSVLKGIVFSFDYGPDKINKPVNIIHDDDTSKIKLKCTGSEMMVFVRYFALLVGEYISEEDKVWELYRQLREVLDRIMTEKVTPADVVQLKDSVEYFLELYREVTNDTLKPKFHFLLHYPAMFLKFGPLARVSTMRFEAKHRVSKIAARAACSRINICKTVAVRHQLTMHGFFLNICKPAGLDCGKATLIDLGKFESLKKVFPDIYPSDIYSVKWVVSDCEKINEKSILIADLLFSDIEPQLVQVEDIYINKANSAVLLSCSQLTNLGFDFHYVAYQVKHSIEKVYLTLDEVFSKKPNTLSVLSNGSMYVTLRTKIT